MCQLNDKMCREKNELYIKNKDGCECVCEKYEKCQRSRKFNEKTCKCEFTGQIKNNSKLSETV